MSMDFKEMIIKLQPYFAIGIFISLTSLSILLYQENNITKTISKECGWAEENFRCICEKSEVIEMENAIINELNGGSLNVTLDR